MHEEWCDALQKCRSIVIAAPRAHAKTSVVSIAYTTWRVGLDPNIRVKIVVNKIELGKEILNAITNVLLFDSKYRLIFPHIRPAKTRYWTKERIYVERTKVLRDPTVEVSSILASGAGGRSDLLICDDIVDQRLVATPGLMRKVRNTFFDVWMNTLEPKDHQVVVIGTIWAEGDLMTELLSNPSFEFRKVYRINNNFDPLWPQVWTREKLFEKWKQDPVAFDRGFRNRPVSTEDALFPSLEMDPAWKLGTTQDPPEIVAAKEAGSTKVHYYTGVDLSTKKKSHDYSVIFTIGVDETTQLRWPVDIRRLRASSPDVARAIIEVYEKFQPLVIMVESNAYQHALIDWISEMKKLPLQAYYTGAQKHNWDVGIRSLRVELQNKLWRIPYWDHSMECDCPWCAWKKEVLSYPWGLHDDTVIAWWLAREGYRAVRGGRRQPGYAVFTW